MGVSSCCVEEEIEYPINDLIDYEMPKISDDIFDEVEKNIKTMTGFEPYRKRKIPWIKERNKIEGTYYQYNKGCILYALINNGHIDEKDVPESMKHYKDHSHKEDERNDTDLLKRCMSVIDLAQLWMNVGGECPYLEIELEEARKRIYFVLYDYFNNSKNVEITKKMNTELLKKIEKMTWQNKDYFELLGKVKVKSIPLIEISEIKDNPCIKNAIYKNIIKERDIIKYGRHCFIFDKIIIEGSIKKYLFQDSLAYFRKDDENYNNCDFSKKGYILANEESLFININNPKAREIGIAEIKF